MDGSPNVDLVDDDDDEDNPSVVGAMMAETDHPIIRINAQLDQLDIHRRSYINMVSLICFMHTVYCTKVVMIHLDQSDKQTDDHDDQTHRVTMMITPMQRMTI